MNRKLLSISLMAVFSLSGCGAGETAAVATLQAEQAKQAQQQMQQLKQQVELANQKSNVRLQEATQANQ
jgi:outer membrane lipoprotein SlyB